MALSKLQAALASVTNEFTLTAAQINFDFTLIKCEAPAEFQQLGNVLSKERKDDAECGPSHVTARRLGALFKGVCPRTPSLLRAYGSRVSDIAEIAQETTNPEPGNSIFAAHSGVDGTSIWAAATSSETALHLHLLACMLARVWKASEAISLWVEIVNERRKEVATQWEAGETLPIDSLAGANQASQISRAGLADLDASARAWLRTADRVMKKQQTQLMLLVANLSIAVNQDMETSSSVLAAWKAALESVEKLINGVPQATNSGPTLLALSSWHLYPDMLIMGGSGVEHHFQDELINAGGTLTVGLSHRDVTDSGGVYWSLSLAHMKYYGKPVRCEGRLNLESTSVTFDQFTFAVWGTLLHRWHVPLRQEHYVGRLFTTLVDYITTTALNSFSDDHDRSACLGFMRDSSHWLNILARAAVAYKEGDHEEDNVAQKLLILGRKRSPQFFSSRRSTVFGFDDPSRLLSCLRGPNERIAFLRRVVSRAADIPSGKIIIRASHSDESWVENRYSVATALPIECHCSAPDKKHHRWAPPQLLEEVANCDEHVYPLHQDVDGVANFKFDPSQLVDSERTVWVSQYGNPEIACIFRDQSSPRLSFPAPTAEDLMWCLENNLVSASALLTLLADNSNDELNMLKAFSIAARVFKPLVDATVSIHVMSKPIYSTYWALEGTRELGADPASNISRETSFSCVAYMETGFNIRPSALSRVFALAYEDSIYVCMRLACDPSEDIKPYEMKRVLGNIGKPGLTLMIPPENLMVQTPAPSDWKVISTDNFNGLPENHFSKTSLHLSFTGYRVPLVEDVGLQGQDNQVFLLETVVSVYDAGKWIGDIDILKALSTDLCVVNYADGICTNPGNCPASEWDSLKSVEIWSEIIDPPLSPFIVRANGS